MITVRTRSAEGEHEVAGALFGKQDLRIVRVDGFAIEAIPSGHLVVLSNEDVPGVIGRIATYLGDARINIGRFYLGRKRAGGEAMAVIETDEAVGDEQLGALAALPNILSARRVEL
jgi:D-3-phosphoglycerate dehydrogenase / 2-oxoglutarate reductase